jgi:hypothetical protein
MLLLSMFALFVAAQEALPDNAVLRLTGHADGLRSVAWSPDGRYLLTGSRDRTLALWDAATGERIRVLEGHEGGVTSVAFSPDGALAVSGSQDKSLALWDVATGKLLRRMNGHALWVTCVAFSPDGRHALSGSLDHTAVLWDTTDGSNKMTFAGHGDRLQAVDFSPDGKQALSASADRTVLLWDVEKGTRLERFVADDAVLCAGFTPADNHILAGTWVGLVQRWDRAGKDDTRVFRGHVGNVHGIALNPDGLTYASSGRDGSVIIGDALTGRRLKRYFGHQGQVWSVAWSPGGRRLATCAEDGTALVWEPWRPAAAEREEWARAWKGMTPEARNEALKNRLKTLKNPDAAALAETREWLLQAGEEIVGPMLELFAPGVLGTEPPEEQLQKILVDLDSETFSVRVQTRKDLASLGRGALPWIEGKLKNDKTLSAEVRSSLEDLRQTLKSAKVLKLVDDGRGRAVQVLLELPRGNEVKGALKKYAQGAEESSATKAARPAARP